METQTTLYPSRISCPSIPGTMKGIVMSIPGVHQVDVRYEERALVITFDDAQTDVQAIIVAVGAEMGIALSTDALATKTNDQSDTCPT